jgi:hypothetical protein
MLGVSGTWGVDAPFWPKKPGGGVSGGVEVMSAVVMW